MLDSVDVFIIIKPVNQQAAEAYCFRKLYQRFSAMNQNPEKLADTSGYFP